MKIFLRIFDYFASHRRWLWGLLLVLVAVLAGLAATLRYREDITDFLPVDDEYKESAAVYQQISEASRIVIIFEGNDPDSLCDALDVYAAHLEERSVSDSVLSPEALVTTLDLEGYMARLRFVHSHAPFFLTDSDYTRLDTLLTPAAITAAVSRDKAILSMPGTGVMKGAIASDPLSLFPLSMGATGQYAGASQAFTSYAGYMMTADERMAFAFYDTPYGSTESSRNGVLCDALNALAKETMAAYPTVGIRLLGAPVVAVGNARRIKLDSLLSVLLALVLIVALLWYAFPRKRDILLIMLAVGFGWLFGMAMLRLVAVRVSIIVLGIGSIIVGIAVNYPLHLLVHQRYTTSVRQTLEEVLSPLVVGNITTVGAFLALIPLKATALRDLGIFAAAMLLGTILFCILFLPHMMSATPTPVREIHILPKRFRERDRKFPTLAVGISLTVLTILAAVLPSLIRKDWRLFDSNMSHINYMTPQQRSDFAFFESLSGQSDAPAYLATSARDELARRAALWTDFWAHHDADSVILSLQSASVEAGFREDAFAPFISMLQEYVPQDGTASDSLNAVLSSISPLGESEGSVLSSISPLGESEGSLLAALWPGRFDSAALNARVASALSDNFDYLGGVCSLIVFLFLWLSFATESGAVGLEGRGGRVGLSARGSLKGFVLALIAFLPMAVSWVWIIAIMRVCGLQFNIVNVILATFIFGQGDDYTIFILEGLLYEERTGKRMLPQYKQSIILSALIMLIGIGVLVIAAHPAMHSLGTVTLIGMSCVVLMAWLVPPVLFRLALRIPRLRRIIVPE